MEFLVSYLYFFGVCLSVALVSSFSDLDIPKAEQLEWISLDFKTVLKWTAPPSDYPFTVAISDENGEYGEWLTVEDCLEITDTVCDLTHDVKYFDRSITADVMTEGLGDFDPEEFPHAQSVPFNPYRESELSAVSFSIQKVSERSVTLNISDPLTGIHEGGRQLSIRDVLKKDLKYKVSYYKSGSTGKRDLVVDSNLPQIPNLNPGQSYCFMVAAFVPSRAKNLQQGAWSTLTHCTSGSNVLNELELSTVFQAIFIPLVLIIIVVTVAIVYCRFCRKRKNSSSSAQEAQPTAQYTTV